MTEAETETAHADLLTRHAHLTELTVNRYLAGELEGEELAFAQGHIDVCEPCHARVDTIRSFDAGFAIAPPSNASNVVSLEDARASRKPNIAMFGVMLAAAAAMLFVVLTQQQPASVEPDDGIRIKGKELTLEVYAKPDDGEARAVGNGDVVHPGERLGFKVTSRRDGFLMVVGIDDSGQIYPGWPQQSGAAEFMPAEDGPRDLEAAVRLDNVGAHEKLVLMRCETRFDLETARSHLVTTRSLRDRPAEDPKQVCVYDEVSLKKQR